MRTWLLRGVEAQGAAVHGIAAVSLHVEVDRRARTMFEPCGIATVATRDRSVTILPRRYLLSSRRQVAAALWGIGERCATRPCRCDLRTSAPATPPESESRHTTGCAGPLPRSAPFLMSGAHVAEAATLGLEYRR